MSPVSRGHTATPPDPGEVRPFELPEIQTRPLDIGFDLKVVRLPRLPIVTAVVALPVGEAAVDPEHAGLALLSADALEGGTRRRSATELAEALESMGATLSLGAGWDATTVSLTCLAERLPEALALLAEVVREPLAEAQEVERIRGQMLARIRQRAMDPSSLASDWAARLIYADGVPYGRPLGGTAASVSALGVEELEGFRTSWYRPQGAGLVLVGDLDAEASAELAVRHFLDGWVGNVRPPASPEASPRSLRRRVHLVHRPGAVQSEVRVGHPGVARGHPDHFPLLIANTVFGGSFTSRLNLNLRERHGFTYGVRSRFSMRRGAGPFLVSTAVESDVTGEAALQILSELETFAREGPSDAEVEAARDYVAGVFPLRMETTGQLAARITELLIYDLPADYHARYREEVRGVTGEDARRAARTHFRPGEATVVVVGDADRVKSSLEALGAEGGVELHEGDT